MAFTDGGLKAKCTIFCRPFLSIIPPSSCFYTLFPFFSIHLQLPTKPNSWCPFLLQDFLYRNTHSHTLTLQHSTPQGKRDRALMSNVVVSGGLSDCSHRQKQMCLSQIQLVPFFLSRQERKANDKQILQEYTSTSLLQYCLLQVTSISKWLLPLELKWFVSISYITEI